MSVSSGFYDAALVDGAFDREYSSLEMGSIFDGIINDGVYASIGQHFETKASQGMTVLVGSGRAWFNHSWIYSDNDYRVTLDAADAAQGRIDAIYLEINRDVGVRSGSIKYKKGVPSSSPQYPDMIRSLDVNQYMIAAIYVGPDVYEIRQFNIDQRVGTSDCPFVTGVLSTVTTDELVRQWEARFEILFGELKAKTDQVVQGTIPDGSVSSTYIATYVPEHWYWQSSDDAYAQGVVIPGLKTSDKPIIDLYLDGYSRDEQIAILEAWENVYRCKPVQVGNTVELWIYSNEILPLYFKVQVMCIRK